MTTILQSLADPQAFGHALKDPGTWTAWRAAIKAFEGEPLKGKDLATFREHTGRKTPPDAPAVEGWLICGRRSGKTLTAALIAAHTACFKSFREHLAPGETPLILCLAVDRRQARVLFQYIRGLIAESLLLKELIVAETAESLTLATGNVIEVATADWRLIRGRTVALAVCDELAFWRSGEMANPDHEILAALKPSLATLPGSRLIVVSSPHARRGELYRAHQDHFGKDGDPVLVWRAPSRRMNPTLPQDLIDKALADDPQKASAEYLAEFRSDLEAFVSREVVTACTVEGRHELPFVAEHRYAAFCDPSGGAADAMTLGIAHAEDDTLVLDLVRERRPPFNPTEVVTEFADMLKRYHLHECAGDRYGAQWIVEAFQKEGVTYRHSTRSRGEIYIEALPELNSHRVQLLDHKRLRSQLLNLERRTSATGRDNVVPGPGHDDLANSAMGAVVEAARAAAQPKRVVSHKPWGATKGPARTEGERLNAAFDAAGGNPESIAADSPEAGGWSNTVPDVPPEDEAARSADREKHDRYMAALSRGPRPAGHRWSFERHCWIPH